MPLDIPRARQHLHNFDLIRVFIEELGWDRHTGVLEVLVDGQSFSLDAVAQKRGLAVYRCAGQIPDYPTRRKIEKQVAKSVHEHLIIYTDGGKSTQIWQWVKRQTGKPTACREHWYNRNQSGDALLQKLQSIVFSLEEEEKLTIVDVTSRARAAFDVERVTKRFYDRFKSEHAAFLKFIKGIPDDELHRWYASVMLNRLMFIYFIQKKEFLNGDLNYLASKLKETKQQGRDRFYREFLCPLFFEGFAKKESDRPPQSQRLLGKIPYLNGGIFLRHQIEELHGKSIQIPDAAFEKLFAFFDEFQWHLDERPLRNDKEINPDVLGYIFEKYINQKQMGAYYTKEDITGYISQNTVIPSLFDTARPKCKIAFENPNGPTIWELLKTDPERYIYPAVLHGKDQPFPADIAAGLNDVSQRTSWNKAAPDDFALPTEIWREVVARRTRYEEIRSKLATGDVRDINELITLNLDIRQFAQDVIENCEGPELLRAFWHAIEHVTILDPTCGSGAFLFAALNILEPLYEACLDRMEAFVEDLDRSGEKHRPEKFSDFRKVLENVAAHPNRRYFIFKSIILNNLFGVDIMEEAVEICKLRLFLKLAAQVEPDATKDNFGIEPLPDIDFNIRAGNTLVGYATADEVRRAFKEGPGGQAKLLLGDSSDAYERFEEQVELADRAFNQFRDMQTEHGMDAKDFMDAKQTLRERLKALEEELNRYLAGEYGVKVPSSSESGTKGEGDTYARWVRSHQPFHWFVEFYGILEHGGFDVIVGNPPYVNAAKVRHNYTVKNLTTKDCPDIYAWVLERVASLQRDRGRNGMIIPLSLGFSGDFAAIRALLYTSYERNWFSSFGRIPSALFSFDVRVRNTIQLGLKGAKEHQNYTTRLHRWFEAARPHLFATLEYTRFKPELWRGRIPKLNTQQLADAFENCLKATTSRVEVAMSPRATKHVLNFKKTAYNWLNFCRELPPCYEDSRCVEHTKFGEIYFRDSEVCQVAMLLGNGKLEFVFWCAIGDDFDVTRWNFGEFPIDFNNLSSATRTRLLALVPKLEAAMNNAIQFKLNAGRRVGNYNLAKCRYVTDSSDQLFAEHLGISSVWEDVELYCSQVVKTDYSTDSSEDAQ